MYEQNERKNYKLKLPRLETLLVKHQKQYKAIEKQEFIIEGQTIMEHIKAKKSFHDEYKNTLRQERVFVLDFCLLFNVSKLFYFL